MSAAIPTDHDDNSSGPDGRASHRAGIGSRRRIAPAAGPRRGGRTAVFSGDYPVYHTGNLSLSGQVFRQGAIEARDGARGGTAGVDRIHLF